MANYFLHVKTFARGRGSKVTKAAAYRAGERIRDERTSAVYDHTGRMDRVDLRGNDSEVRQPPQAAEAFRRLVRTLPALRSV